MISFIVPAYNEERFLAGTVSTIKVAAGDDEDFEIVVIDDGSTDFTPKLADELQAADSRIRALHNDGNRGLGYSIRRGIAAAAGQQLMIIPGDGDLDADTISRMLEKRGQADLIVLYLLNREVRGKLRNLLSLLYNLIYLLSFDIYVMYINGPAIYPAKLVKEMNLCSDRFSIICEMTIKTLRCGVTYVEVPGYMRRGTDGSSAIGWKNFAEAGVNYLKLLHAIYVADREKFAHRPLRKEA